MSAGRRAAVETLISAVRANAKDFSLKAKDKDMPHCPRGGLRDANIVWYSVRVTASFCAHLYVNSFVHFRASRRTLITHVGLRVLYTKFHGLAGSPRPVGEPKPVNRF